MSSKDGALVVDLVDERRDVLVGNVAGWAAPKRSLLSSVACYEMLGSHR